MIAGFDFTAHAERMLIERGIAQDWVIRAVREPARIERRSDGTIHYLKQITERGDRILRVVVVHDGNVPRVITAFFDRREKGEI